MLARLKRFSFISIPNDRQFVKRVSEKILMDLAILRGICSLQTKKRFFTESWGKSSLEARLRTRKVTGRDACCLRLCWRLPWDWSDEEQLGRCPKPHKGRCPLTLQGADEKGRSPPLDPFSRLSWSRFHAPSACSFLVLRQSLCLLPRTSREEPKNPPNRA